MTFNIIKLCLKTKTAEKAAFEIFIQFKKKLVTLKII